VAELIHDASLLALLAAGETGSEGLAAGLGVPARTVQYRLARLRERGLVVSPTRGAWRLTGAGQRAALEATIAEPSPSLDALDALPAEHRALLRLIEDAVVARRALGAVYPTNWPGFVLLGPTKTGKTLLGTIAARRFGLDPADVIRLLMLETPGSLLGRRVQTSAGTWTSVPSALLSAPLVVLDEYDKAGPELRAAAFAYLAGASRYRVEGIAIDVTATAILTLNTERDPARLLPDAYVRRSVVLDTTPLRAVTADLDETARRLARAALPLVDPDLVPPAPELPELARRRLRDILRGCLTDRGWELVDVEAIARLALGRWAVAPADAEAAVLSVAADYLLVSATRPGLVEPDWPPRLEAIVGGAVGPIATTLASARARRAAGEQDRASAARTALDLSLALAGERERLRDALDHAVRSAPRGRDLALHERGTIATARGTARPFRDALAAARSLDALHELDERLGREVLAPLGAVSEAVEKRRDAAEEARARAVEDRRDAADRKRTERAAAQTDRRAATARHAELEALYRRSVTRPGEDVVGALLEARCLVRQRDAYEVETLGSRFAHSGLGRRLGSLGAADPPARTMPPDSWAAWLPVAVGAPPVEPARRYERRVRVWYVDGAGRRVDAADLLTWGSDAVRAVIAAAADAAQLQRLTLPRRRAAVRNRTSPSSRRRP
jgi:hypothetical protein